MLRIPIITPFLKRREQRRLRRAMRGYRSLRETGQLGKIAAVKDAVANTPLNVGKTQSSEVLFGAGIDAAEMAVRQYLLVRLGSLNLNKVLLHALGDPRSPVVYPLPREWRQVLRRHGFTVSEFGSALAWHAYVALHLAFGAFAIARRAFESIIEIARPSIPRLGRYAFFHGLSLGNLPTSGGGERSHDVLSWYLQWSGRIPVLDSVCHSVSGAQTFNAEEVAVVHLRSAIRPLAGGQPLARYIGWGIAAILTSTLDLIRGRWWHGLILSEASQSALIRLSPAGDLARDYLFHNSAWIYRPLWTYEAERLGSRITFYFYSTHCETFKRADGYPLQENFWQVMNWPFYVVWDEYQADFVRRAVGDFPKISVSGPIWFQTGTREMPKLAPRSVVVFDVEPHRKSRYQLLGLPQEYFVPETASQFLIDIHDALAECGATMVLKRKRAIGKLLNRRYAAVVDTLTASNHFLPIDPSISAFRVVESCAAVISMPFTSTALLAREIGKPSVYYDPLGMVQKDDRAAHGIEVLSGRTELRAWLSSILTPATGVTGDREPELFVRTRDSIDSGPAPTKNKSTAQ